MENNEIMAAEAGRSAKKGILKTALITTSVILAILILVNGIIIAITALAPDWYDGFKEKYLDEMTFSMAIQAVIMLAAILVGAKASDIKLGSYFAKPKISFSDTARLILIGIALGQGTTIFINVIITVIQAITGEIIGTVNFIADRNPVSAVIMFALMAFIIPLFEELMFRGIFMSPLLKYGKWFAVIASSIVFGLYHMNLQQIFGAFVLGLFMTIISVKAQSIIPALAFHMINNTIAATQYAAMGTFDTNRITESAYVAEHIGGVSVFIGVTILNFTLILVGIIVLIVTLATKGKKFFSLGNDPEYPLTKKGNMKAYFLSAPIVVLIVVFIGMTAFTIIAGRG